METRRPLQAGALMALVAAIAFGITAPLIKRAGHDVGAFYTAALLYFGAALFSFGARLTANARDTAVQKRDLTRLVVVAALGAALAPAALAWGLQRTTAVTGSLLLNGEALFTALFAWIFYREHVGRRVAFALALIAAGGVLLVCDGTQMRWSLGALAIVLAAIAWAGDNSVGRVLADRDPAQVVAYKATIGVALSLACGAARHERAPHALAALALIALGATGYGASLRLYLRAQRTLGAARTGSIFATAPFVGALVAVLLGERIPSAFALAGAALCAIGVYLHVTEHHSHRHLHAPLSHDHWHRHDDGHHSHRHSGPIADGHAHPHDHETIEHEHEHAPDLHHPHDHG